MFNKQALYTLEYLLAFSFLLSGGDFLFCLCYGSDAMSSLCPAEHGRGLIEGRSVCLGLNSVLQNTVRLVKGDLYIQKLDTKELVKS